jgi:hypothetical protein
LARAVTRGGDGHARTYDFFHRECARNLSTSVPFSRLHHVVYVCVMKRTNIYLTDEQVAKLKKLSDKTGAPMSEIVRRAIEAYLKKSK